MWLVIKVEDMQSQGLGKVRVDLEDLRGQVNGERIKSALYSYMVLSKIS